MKRLFILLFLFSTIVCFGQKSEPTTIFLIRHAEKVVDGTKNPVLTKTGEEQAKKWASILKSEEIDLVYSTNYIRTLSTAKPIAEANDITEVKVYDPRNFDLNKFITEVKGKSVVVVGHSNTIPMLVNSLIKEERYAQIDDSDFSNLFIVHYTSVKNADAILLRIN